MDFLRKKIREILLESESIKLLTEDLQDQKDLQTLANCIILELAEENFENVQRWLKNSDGQPLLMDEPIYMSIIHQKYQNRFNFKELKKSTGKPTVAGFITYCPHIWTEMSYRPNYSKETSLASFVRLGNSKYIELYYKNDFSDKIRSDSKIGFSEFNKTGFYTTLYYKFSSYLLHELQHAFDDFRSGGKAIDDNGRVEYEKMEVPDKGEVPEEIWIKFNNDKAIKYLNLSHEVWARFAQVVEKIKFRKSLKSYVIDNGLTTIYEMVPFDKGPKQALQDMNGWSYLDENVRKRVMKALYNIWQQTADKTREENKLAQEKIRQNPDAKLFEDKIAGGLSDKLSIEDIAKKHGVSLKQLKTEWLKGKKVELEHTSDPATALEIAKDHLVEDPFYYTKLAKLDL